MSLEGIRVAVTRPRTQATELAELLQQSGATVILMPAIEIQRLDDSADIDRALHMLPDYDWLVFTSVNAVDCICARMAALGVSASAIACKTAAIGPKTAERLCFYGLQPDFVPSAYHSDALASELPNIAGKRVLLPTSDVAPDSLAVALRDAGAEVDSLVAYRTVAATITRDALNALQNGVDVITYASGSACRGFNTMLSEAGIQHEALLSEAIVACIGPKTAGAAENLGMAVEVVAQEHTATGLVQALQCYFARKSTIRM